MRGLVLLLCAALPVAALAQTYKWVDENGQTHFTQVPPKSGKYDVIGAPPPPSAAPNQDAINKSLSDAQKAAPEQAKAAAQAEMERTQKQENCRKAIERIAYLDARTPRRLATTDDKGNPSRMTDEEFTRQRAAEEEKMRANCQ